MSTKQLRALLKQNTIEVAKGLIGQKLSTMVDGKLSSGIIVETEAYGGLDDEASHSFRGITKRNEQMFGRPGCCYVYFIYGMHYCVNVVTEAEGTGAAVLIRALEPLDGIPLMQARRGVNSLRDLTNGPAKLCEALAIDKSMLGEDFLNSKLIFIEPCKKLPAEAIGCSQRIGISKSTHLKKRYFLRANGFVSR